MPLSYLFTTVFVAADTGVTKWVVWRAEYAVDWLKDMSGMAWLYTLTSRCDIMRPYQFNF